MVLLAHIWEAFHLSHGTYGSPRMSMELKDRGLCVGRRRVARLMQENGLKARQPRRYRRTTDSHHGFPVAPNLLGQDFTASRPNDKWVADISYIWTQEGAGCILRSLSTCTPEGSWAGQPVTGAAPGPGPARAENGAGPQAADAGPHPSFRPGQPVCIMGVSKDPESSRHPHLDERQGELLR